MDVNQNSLMASSVFSDDRDKQVLCCAQYQQHQVGAIPPMKTDGLNRK